MLTGLPMGDYKHEDLAKLVWRYFPKQNLHSLYYNMTVLPLQRRVRSRKWRLLKETNIIMILVTYLSSHHLQAFVHFPDWTSCIKFLRDPCTESYHIKKRRLTSHFVLDYMKPESSEVWNARKSPNGAFLAVIVCQDQDGKENQLLEEKHFSCTANNSSLL